MNINNIDNTNNPLIPKRPVDRKQDVTNTGPGQAEKTPETEKTREVTQVPVNEGAESAATEGDTFRVSDEPKLVEELTNIVENMEEAPREDAVTRTSERARNGYYETDDFISRLAVTMVNTERLSD